MDLNYEPDEHIVKILDEEVGDLHDWDLGSLGTIYYGDLNWTLGLYHEYPNVLLDLDNGIDADWVTSLNEKDTLRDGIRLAIEEMEREAKR